MKREGPLPASPIAWKGAATIGPMVRIDACSHLSMRSIRSFVYQPASVRVSYRSCARATSSAAYHLATRQERVAQELARAHRHWNLISHSFCWFCCENGKVSGAREWKARWPRARAVAGRTNQFVKKTPTPPTSQRTTGFDTANRRAGYTYQYNTGIGLTLNSQGVTRSK